MAPHSWRRPVTGTNEALIVVAHPDDETLWAGGTIIDNPSWSWTIVALCRRDDPDRAPRFARVLDQLGATGAMGDLDDGPDQAPLSGDHVVAAVADLLPARAWARVLTHSPFGEYTRHRRHEEVSRAVVSLWRRGTITAGEIFLFAYEDGGRTYLPRAVERADQVTALDDNTFSRKYGLITNTYGFAPDSWEARATPRTEAFWRFESATGYDAWLRSEEVLQGRDNR